MLGGAVSLCCVLIGLCIHPKVDLVDGNSVLFKLYAALTVASRFRTRNCRHLFFNRSFDAFHLLYRDFDWCKTILIW